MFFWNKRAVEWASSVLKEGRECAREETLLIAEGMKGPWVVGAGERGSQGVGVLVVVVVCSCE